MKPVLFVGMGGTGKLMLDQLFRRIEEKNPGNQNIFKEYIFGFTVDTDAQDDESLHNEIKNFRIDCADPEKSLNDLLNKGNGFDEIWPKNRLTAPRPPAMPGAGEDPSFSMLSLFWSLESKWADFLDSFKTPATALPGGAGNFFSYKGTPVLPIVYVGGMCGGTGPGLNLFLPQIINKAFSGFLGGVEHARVVNIGMFWTPEATALVKEKGVNSANLANAYANMLTLDNWQAMRHKELIKKIHRSEFRIRYRFPTGFDGGAAKSMEFSGYPYEMIYLVGDRLNGGQRLTQKQVSSIALEYLYATFCGSNTSGPIFSDFSNSWSDRHGGSPCKRRGSKEFRAQSYGAFGLSRLQFPKRNIRKYCLQYVAARWRAEFIDSEIDATPAWDSIAGSMGLRSVDDVVKNFRKNVLVKHKNVLLKDVKGLELARVSITQESQTFARMKKQKSSAGLAGEIDRVLEEIEKAKERQESVFNDESVSEMATELYGEEIHTALLFQLRGMHGEGTEIPRGKQGAYVLNIQSAALKKLKQLVGKDVSTQVGLQQRIVALHGKVDKSLQVLEHIKQAGRRAGLLGKGRKLKADIESAIREIKNIKTLSEEILLLEAASSLVNSLQEKISSRMGKVEHVLKALLDESFVPQGMELTKVVLPEIAEDNNAQGGLMTTVLYDEEVVRHTWLRDWMGAWDAKQPRNKNKFIRDKYIELSDGMFGVDADRKPRPLQAALEKIMEEVMTYPDESVEQVAREVKPHFEEAVDGFESQVIPDLQNMTVWQALWKEAEWEAATKGSGIQDAGKYAQSKLEDYYRMLQPVLTMNDKFGDLEGVAPERSLYFVGPKLAADFDKDHPIHNIVKSVFAGISIKECGGSGGNRWNSFLLGITSIHALPASHMFDFEGAPKTEYQKMESSANQGGELYLHPEYAWRDQYQPLAMGDASLNLERELVILCEYIAAKRPKELMASGTLIPTITRKGGFYTVVSEAASEKIQGREKLYMFFGQNPEFRDSVQKSIQEWLEPMGAPDKKKVVQSVLTWVNARSRNEKNKDYKRHYEEDARIWKEFAERD